LPVERDVAAGWGEEDEDGTTAAADVVLSTDASELVASA
jgi:hypothetical protein